MDSLPRLKETQFHLDLSFHTEASDPALSLTPFPEDQANDLARLESFNKHLYRPNTYLHKWWARRSGTTFRHILKQLVADPARRDFYAPGGLEGKIVLDPMMGGGTTLHEAIRLGANVIGVDIDPIPVLQARAALTRSPLLHKQRAFMDFLGGLRAVLSPLYRTTCPTCDRDAETQFVLYALRRRCRCREALFVDSLTIRHNRGHDVRLCPHCRHVYTEPDHRCAADAAIPLFDREVRRCPDCDSPYADLRDAPYAQRYVPLVVVGACPQHAQFFTSVRADDLAHIARAGDIARSLDFGDPDRFRIPDGPKSGDLLQRAITDFRDLFTPRQLIYLHTANRLLADHSPDDRLWLALLTSTSLEFNSLLCGYKGSDIRRPGAIRHVFSHHAYSFPYTALENNPVFFGESSGTLRRLFRDRIERAARWAVAPEEPIRLRNEARYTRARIQGEIDGGEPAADWSALKGGQRRFLVLQHDSSTLEIPPGLVDYVVTDPPYYDNVQYSDLSNFFRTWLRLFLPDAAQWSYDQLASAVSEGDSSAGRKFGDVLAGIWKMCHCALNPEHGALIFTFHHWRPDAWAELALSLRRARFTLADRYAVFSENPTSVHIQNLKSLQHDAILVLTPDRRRAPASVWPQPDRIATTDSAAFCRDCAAALGWFLTADLDEEAIRAGWRRLFEGEPNGPRPTSR
jgi:hypothetical protein